MVPKSNIETLNALSLSDFQTHLWPNTSPDKIFSDDQPFRLLLESSSTISPSDFNACVQLITDTSSEDYAASSFGWHPTQKRKEMRLPDLKYALLKHENGPLAQLAGFISFMVTYEDGIEVIYCYEIHLEPRHRGKGLGKYLIERMEELGRRAGMKKAMLTVFRVNQMARRFYERLGYEEDEYSPRPRKLRGGVVKEADYMILSKPLTGDHGELIA